MRRAARTDSTQADIVSAMRAMGASVYPLHMVGGDFPDLAVGFLGVNVLMEVKRADGPPSKRKLTEGQERFRREWKGPVCMVNDIDGAIRVLKTIEANVCEACRAKAGGFVRVTVEPT
jgi:hypothetical protein